MESRDLSVCPKARTEGLVIESIDNELVVYDDTTKRAHCLNRSAALVWGYCDGKTAVAAMAARLAADAGSTANEDVVLFALRQLAERDLLDRPLNVSSDVAMNRRQLLMGLGAAAVLVPVVTSLVAPSSAAATSAGSSGSSGTSGSSGSSGGSSGGSS